MRALDVFAARHRFARQIFVDELWSTYDEATFRTPPHETMNSLAWIVWHLARVEDAGVSRFVTGEDQLLHADGWNDRLALDVVHFGFGCDRRAMLDISESVDLSAARAYYEAVGDRTLASLGSLSPERLEEPLRPDEVEQVLVVEGVGVDPDEETIDLYSTFDRLEALFHFSATHYYWHGGEIRTIEGILRG